MGGATVTKDTTAFTTVLETINIEVKTMVEDTYVLKKRMVISKLRFTRRTGLTLRSRKVKRLWQPLQLLAASSLSH